MRESREERERREREAGEEGEKRREGREEKRRERREEKGEERRGRGEKRERESTFPYLEALYMCRHSTSMNWDFSMQPRHSAAASTPRSLSSFRICFMVHDS